MAALIEKIRASRDIQLNELTELLETDDHDLLRELASAAQSEAVAVFGHNIYIRGLIEISNICKNNCYYCGIRRDNANVERYRLDKEDILECCCTGYELGFRTFVLQGGEDGYYTDERLCDIIRSIKAAHPDCAVTLSLGERSFESYRALKEAGADRYLLRHETANEEHYKRLHPASMSLQNRKKCLFDLKSLGFQVVD